MFLIFSAALTGSLSAQCPEAVNGMALFDLRGKPAKLPCSSHKVLIINLWATWCAPCRVEIPILGELYRELKPRGVEVVGISLDSMKPESLEPMVASLKIPYPVYIGSAEEILSKMAVMAVPATFIINSRGKIYRTLIGYHSKDELLAPIKELLDNEQEKN